MSAFERKLFERREAAARAAASVAPPGVSGLDSSFDDVIPEEVYERTDVDKALDAAIQSIDIVTAYIRWCGKMTPKIGAGQTESIMVSCPKPNHRDSNPSAFLNTEKNTWYCAACQEGGDPHDIAAYRFGYPVPGYKKDSSFRKLRMQMATDFGYTFHKLPGGATYIEAPVVDEEPELPPPPVTIPAPIAATPSAEPAKPVVVETEAPVEEPDDEPLATVTSISPDFDDEEDIIMPSLNWRAIVPAGSFMSVYMNATTIDDVPEEYHFFNGLMAVGFALGRRARLFDQVPVYGNLFVCTLGNSGSGKSKARYHQDRLLNLALPYDATDPESRGVLKVSAPGSAEVLIHNFQKPIADPSTPKKIDYYAPVTGIIDYSELSALIGRANRVGNAIKPTLMQFYDMEGVISTSSMTTGIKQAVDPFASAITSTQPKALKTLLGRTDDDSGFLNRWVFVAGPEKKRFAIGGALVDIGPAVDPLRRILGWSGSFGDDQFVEWSRDAEDKFTAFFHDVIEPAKKNAASALITRIDLFMKKLILLLAGNKMEEEVSGETVQQAIDCYDYVIACYAIPEAQIGNSLMQEVSDAILGVARKQFEKDGKGVTLSSIARSLARRKYPHDLVLKTCDGLAKLGFLDMQTAVPGATGRPTVRYKYVG